MGKPASYYDVLEIDPEASAEEVKRAYYSKAKRLHPDVNSGSAGAEGTAFEEVRIAYDVLKDPKKRARHDRARGITRRFGRHGPDGFGPGTGRRALRIRRGGMLAGLLGGLLTAAIQSAVSLLGDIILLLAPRRSKATLPGRARPFREVRLYVEDNLPVYEGEHVRIRTPSSSEEIEVIKRELVTALQGLVGNGRLRLVALDFGADSTRKLLAVVSSDADPSFFPSTLALPEILTGVLIARIDSGPFYDEVVRRGVDVPLVTHPKVD